MKVCFETFGCRLSRAEALQEEAGYLAKGWEITEKHSEADLIIVRGCSVTRRAQHDCEKLIAHLQHHYPLTQLVVCGCLPKKLLADKRNLHSDASANTAPAIPTRTARAYLKVQDGCNGRCTFCIVPQFRGESRSVDFTELMDRAKRMIAADYHEIVVTGCNLALYASQGKRLAELASALAELDAGCRVRIGSIEPGNAAEELVETMAEHQNICRFLHIPVQSGSNRILTAMHRPYLVKDVDRLIKRATELMPEIGIGCDIMTGFPGELDVDFTMTKGLVKRLPFSNVHVFPYSERPKTIAAGLPGAIPREIRHGRARELIANAKAKRARAARKFIGKDVEMLVENAKERTGWTGEYFSCKVTTARNDSQIVRKHLVKVHIMNAHGDSLRGIII